MRTIRASLAGAFSLVIFIGVLLLGATSLFLFQQALISETQKSNLQLVEQLNRIFDGYIGYMKDLALLVWNNPDVVAFVRDSRPPGGADRRDKVARFLSGIPQIRPDIDSLVLRVPGQRVLTSDATRPLNPWLVPTTQEWYRTGPPAPGAVLSAARIENLYDDRYLWVISLVLGQPPHTADLSGATLQVDLNYAVIDNLCKEIQLGRSGYVFIVNAAGEIVYHPRQQLVYSGLKREGLETILDQGPGQIRARVGGRDLVYTVARSTKTRWTVVAVSYLDELFDATGGIVVLDVVMALACLLVTTLLAWRVAQRISRPIEALRRSMRAVETGNFDVSIQVEADNEVGDLARDCDIAIRQVRHLMGQALVDQEARRQQDLLMLQSQINPHFLYNTLDSIIWMVELNRSEEAITMTSTLAKFFRLGISLGPYVIPLRHELHHVISYLSIQKMRYQDKLDFRVAIPEDLLETPVLKLLLQPLVENALYHGIKERSGRGTITIEGERSGSDLVLRVRDDGVGMAPEVLARVLEARPEEPGTHMGLRNVHERIRLQFGARYGLSFHSVPQGGTTVTIVLPGATP